MHRRLAAATALCATLLLGACTQRAPQPPPPPSGGPSEPSASTSHASPSPTTSEHSDLLEVQELYKTEFAAETEVFKNGGANRLPREIQQRTTGFYQHAILKDFRAAKKTGERQVVGPRLLGIEMGRWTSSKIIFQSCEDYSGVKSVDKDGHPIHRKPGVRAIQKVTALNQNGTWRIALIDATVVKNFDDAPCNGRWYS